MTTLYRPVLIESAEQAEALPLNTLAISADGVDPAIRKADGWHGIFGDPPYSHAEMVSDYALVPIEAEEEGRSMYTDPDTGETRHDFFPDRRADGIPVHTHTRLVTPWEPQQ